MPRGRFCRSRLPFASDVPHAQANTNSRRRRSQGCRRPIRTSEPSRLVTQMFECGTSDATPTQMGRSVGVRGRGAAGHPCTPLTRRLRRCGTARCVSGHGRDGGLGLSSVSLRSSSSEADLELPAEALLHCLDGATLLLGEATQRDTANPLADARPRDGAQIGCGGDGESDTGTLHPCHF